MTASAGDTSSPPKIAARKTALRSTLRRLRRSIPSRQRRLAAQLASRHLLRLLRGCRHIAAYLSVQSEISTAPLIAALQRRGCRVYVPVTLRDGGLRFVPLRPQTPLLRSSLGLPQPAARRGARPLVALDALVLPLLGFDDRGGRLGNGGGFYDRTLASRSTSHHPRRIGLAFAMQQVDPLPVEPWDVPLHAVATERGIIRCKPGRPTE